MRNFFRMYGLRDFFGKGGGGVPLNNQDKTITQNGTYTADEGYTGLGNVTVNVVRDDQTDVEEQFVRLVEGNVNDPVTELPPGLTKIGDYVFYKCTNIAFTSLPSGLTSIGNYVFYNTDLALTALPSGLISIGNSAFYNTYLALTELPAGVVNIGDSAFYSCSKLVSVSLPESLETLGIKAFSNCGSLKEITFKSKPSSIGNSVFFNSIDLRIINVPWAEGEVSGAPWGATYATINYNYTGG